MLYINKEKKQSLILLTLVVLSLFGTIHSLMLNSTYLVITNALIFFISSILIVICYKQIKGYQYFPQIPIVILFIQQILIYRNSQYWVSVVLLQQVRSNSHLSFVALSAILIALSIDYEGEVESSQLERIFVICVLITNQLLILLSGRSNDREAKHILKKQYEKDLQVKIFDKQYNDITVYPKDSMEISTAYTPIPSDRIGYQNTLAYKKKDLCYKIYQNPTQISFIESQLHPTMKVLTFSTMKELLENYFVLAQENTISLVLSVETDFKMRKKIKHKLQIGLLPNENIYVAYVLIEDGIILKYQNSVSYYKYNLSNIFTHKLRTPLNAALGYLTQATKSLALSVSCQDQIKNAYLNCRLLLYCVQDLLDFTQNKAAQCTLQINKVYLQDLLTNLQEVIEYQCQAKNIEIIFRIDGIEFKKQQQKYNIYTDQLKLERILYNLLNNSYRHIPTGGKLVLDVIHDVCENGFYFSVQDTSQLLSEIQIQNYNSQLQLQNQFYFIGRSEERQSKYKIGFTMKITNKLIGLLSEHKSSLQIKRNEDQTTCFTFHIINQLTSESARFSIGHKFNFPTNDKFQYVSSDEISEEPNPLKPCISKSHLIKTELNSISRGQQINLFQSIRFNNYIQQQSTEFQRHRRSHLAADFSLSQKQPNRHQSIESLDLKIETDRAILIVDDEPFNHDILTIMLKNLGFHNFKRAFDGQQCIDIVVKDQQYIKVIIMDIDMPVMGGIQATKILIDMMNERKVRPIPIIGCTAHDDKDTHDSCYEVGMVDVVTKPVLNRPLQQALLKANDVLTEIQRSDSEKID